MWAMIVKEFRQLRRDRRTLAMMIVMPVILLIVFGYAASFDVSLDPEAVVLLPLSVLDEQRRAAEAFERRAQARAARRARPRCDARDHHVQAVTRARDGLLALCAACGQWLNLAVLDSQAVIEALVSRLPDGPERTCRRGTPT